MKLPLMLLYISVLSGAGAEPARFCQFMTDDALISRKESIDDTLVIPECGGFTLRNCLKAAHPCELARLLDDYSCILIEGYPSAPDSQLLITIREYYAALTADSISAIDLSRLPLAGDASAPAVITEYINANCWHCKKLSRELYDEVTGGNLKGKARLCVKPITGALADKALFAANRQGKFWPYYLLLASTESRLDKPILIAAARQTGMDTAAFVRGIEDSSIRTDVMRCRDEGKRNGATITPYLFIDGVHYPAAGKVTWIREAVEYRLLRKMHGDTTHARN